MDVDNLYDWLAWGVLAFALGAMVLVIFLLILMGIAEAVHHLRRWRHGGKTPAPLSIDELLASMPDVPYKQLPPACGDDDRDSCVICQAPYEASESCNVLPGCRHMFHKACIAIWLRNRSTCPLCRAILIAVPGKRQLNAAENMV